MAELTAPLLNVSSSQRTDAFLEDRAPLRAARHFLSRLDQPTTLVLALSGGSDSTALLVAFHAAIAADGRHRLVACTVDHALRPGSGEEARRVAALCASLSVPHEIAHWQHDDVRSAIQAQARLARYRLLSDCGWRHGATLILTGHTVDDQAETVAMRRARLADEDGDSGIGLSGMAEMTLFERRIWIARPFLEMPRQTLRHFLMQRGLSWIEDPSNDNPAFERVRLRHAGEVSSVDPSLWEAARRRRRESSARIAALMKDRLRFHGLALADLTLHPGDLDDPDMRRLLGILAAIFGGRTHAPGRPAMARLVSALQGDRARFAIGRCLFDRRGARLFILRELRGLPGEMPLQPGAAIYWDGRFRIANNGSASLVIRPAGRVDVAMIAVDPSVPRSLAVAAQWSLPVLHHDPLMAETASATHLSPRLAPFDTFLPCFDSTMADCFDSLIGREPFLRSPVHDVLS